jgi:hypothetical protein
VVVAGRVGDLAEARFGSSAVCAVQGTGKGMSKQLVRELDLAEAERCLRLDQLAVLLDALGT